MAYCPECGSAIDNGQAFCASCGYEVGTRLGTDVGSSPTGDTGSETPIFWISAGSLALSGVLFIVAPSITFVVLDVLFAGLGAVGLTVAVLRDESLTVDAVGPIGVVSSWGYLIVLIASWLSTLPIEFAIRTGFPTVGFLYRSRLAFPLVGVLFVTLGALVVRRAVT